MYYGVGGILGQIYLNWSMDRWLHVKCVLAVHTLACQKADAPVVVSKQSHGGYLLHSRVLFCSPKAC